MGHLLSKPVNLWVLHFVRSMTEGRNGKFLVEDFQTEFSLDAFLGRDNAPICQMFITNSSIHCQDLQFNGTSPIRMTSSKITITIGRMFLRCDDLGYFVRIHNGSITIFDVHIKAVYNLQGSLTGFRVTDINGEAKVKKIKTAIKIDINGFEHSRLANVLLSVDNPVVASNLLNVLFLILKDSVKDYFNENFQYIAREYGGLG